MTGIAFCDSFGVDVRTRRGTCAKVNYHKLLRMPCVLPDCELLPVRRCERAEWRRVSQGRRRPARPGLDRLPHCSDLQMLSSTLRPLCSAAMHARMRSASAALPHFPTSPPVVRTLRPARRSFASSAATAQNPRANPWSQPLPKPVEELKTYLAFLPDFAEGSKRWVSCSSSSC